jgi:hypothetical protein
MGVVRIKCWKVCNLYLDPRVSEVAGKKPEKPGQTRFHKAKPRMKEFTKEKS